MPDIEPSAVNNYQVGPTITFSRERWNAVMASIAARLLAREALEASFTALIEAGTADALALISGNVAPQLENLTEQIAALQTQLEDIIGGGTAPNALQLAGQNPSFYLALANATGSLPVAQVSGVDALIAAAVAGLVNSAPSTLDTLKELSDALGGDANFAVNVAAAIGNKLAKSSNLSDLTDTAAARDNLRLSEHFVGKAGDTTTGPLEINYASPRLWFNNTGVKKAGFVLDNSGNLHWQDANGTTHHTWGPDGTYVNQQIGDLNTRIEARTQAWANTRIENIRLVWAGDGPVNNTTYTDFGPSGVVTGGYALNNGGGVTLIGFRVRTLQFLIAGNWYNAVYS